MFHSYSLSDLYYLPYQYNSYSPHWESTKWSNVGGAGPREEEPTSLAHLDHGHYQIWLLIPNKSALAKFQDPPRVLQI